MLSHFSDLYLLNVSENWYLNKCYYIIKFSAYGILKYKIKGVTSCHESRMVVSIGGVGWHGHFYTQLIKQKKFNLQK